MVRLAAPTSQVTCASWVYDPPTRIHVRLLGPCFKTGRLKGFRQHLESAVPPRGTRADFTPCSHARHRPGVKPGQYPARGSHADQRPAHTEAREDHISLGAHAPSNRFPLNNFKHFLTLFSKFFSSFPHGTCSLSVSRQYSALDGIYHQIWAAFPNNPTRGKHLVGRTRQEPTGFSPSRTSPSSELRLRATQRTLL